MKSNCFLRPLARRKRPNSMTTTRRKTRRNPPTTHMDEVLQWHSRALELMCLPESAPGINEFTTARLTSKMWIDPENGLIPLHTWHHEYFRDHPEIAEKYGIPFEDEDKTRLAALRVGFIRINYEINGGFLEMDTMRWDPVLRVLVDQFIDDNIEALDHTRINLLRADGIDLQVAYVSIKVLRIQGKPVNRRALGAWNRFKNTPLPLPKKPAIVSPAGSGLVR